MGSNLQPWKNNIPPAKGMQKALPAVKKIMNKLFRITLGEVSALLFKVNQILNTPEAIAGIQINIKNNPEIEAQFNDALINLF